MVRQLKTKPELDAVIKECGAKLLVIDFTATWCGPCQRIAPKFEAMSQEFPEVTFVKIDVDENEDAVKEFNVNAMPTFVFMKDGKKVDSLTGADEVKLRELVTKLK